MHICFIKMHLVLSNINMTYFHKSTFQVDITIKTFFLQSPLGSHQTYYLG